MRKKKNIKYFSSLLMTFVLVSGLALWKGTIQAEAYNFATKSAERAGTVTIVPIAGTSQSNGYYNLGGYQVTYTLSDMSWKGFDTNSCAGYFYMGNNLSADGGCSFGYHQSGGAVWEDGAVCLGSLSDGVQITRCDAASDTISCTFNVSSLSELPTYIAYGYQPNTSVYIHISQEHGDLYHIWYYQNLSGTSVSSAANLDVTGPTLSVSAVPAGTTVTSGGKTWGKYALIKATAKDTQAGVSKICVYQNGTLLKELSSSNTTQMETEYRVAQNGTFQLRAYDKLNNQSELKSVTVSCVDTQAPTVKSITSETGEVCRNNKITVVAYDQGCGLADKPYSWDGAEWSAESELEVDKNGTYTVRVRDALGNETTASLEISNIDEDAPVIQCVQKQSGKMVSANGISWSTNAILEITVTDLDSGVKWVHLADETGKIITSWERDETKNETTVVIESEELKNGNYFITAEDLVGNLSEESRMEVAGVDDAPPIIQSLTETKTEKGTFLIVKAEDNEGGIGLAGKPYSFDGGKTWQAEPEKQISQNGEYRVIVKDALGLTTEKTVQVTSIIILPVPEYDKEHDKEYDNTSANQVSKTENSGKLATGNIVTPVSTKEILVKEETNRRKRNIAEKENEVQQETLKTPVLAKPFEKKTVESEETTKEPESVPVTQVANSERTKNNQVGKTVFAVLAALVGAGLGGLAVYLLLYWLRTSCVVYGIGENQEKQRLCRLPLYQEDDLWVVRVPDDKLGTHGTGKYLFVFHPSFVKEETSSAIVIRIDGRIMRERLAEEVPISI